MKKWKVIISALMLMVMICAGCSPVGKFSECKAVYDMDELAEMINVDDTKVREFNHKYKGKEIRLRGVVGDIIAIYNNQSLVILEGRSQDKRQKVLAGYVIENYLVEELKIDKGDVLKIQAKYGFSKEIRKGCVALYFHEGASNENEVRQFSARTSVSGIEQVAQSTYVYNVDILLPYIRDKYISFEEEIKGKDISVRGILACILEEKVYVEGIECNLISIVCEGGEVIAAVTKEELYNIGYPDLVALFEHFKNNDAFPSIVLKGKPSKFVKGMGLVFGEGANSFNLTMGQIDILPEDILTDIKLGDIAHIELAKDYSRQEFK